MTRITIWNEHRHERKDERVARIYPQGIHGAIMAGLRAHGLNDTRAATLDDPEHGLTDDVLNSTDVLVWWGHLAHSEVDDAVVARVHARVLDGMGLLVLHSGHFSKIFQRLLGTTCNLVWREAGERERIWTVATGHPIADGLADTSFVLAEEEMYGEPFDIPAPDELVFVSWFAGGEVFRSGACWTRGRGRIFYFRPGHETHPTYHDANVHRVIANGVRWAAPQHIAPMQFGNRRTFLDDVDGGGPLR